MILYKSEIYFSMLLIIIVFAKILYLIFNNYFKLIYFYLSFKIVITIEAHASMYLPNVNIRDRS